MRRILTVIITVLVRDLVASAEVPTANYIFPAGGQRGTTVNCRIGGCNLHRVPRLIWTGTGITAPVELKSIETVWFEGPVIPQPASQQKEDYPRDFGAQLQIDNDASPGRRVWRLATSQGVTTGWGFIVGDFPEIVEQEVEGVESATQVELPVTINGRIFPREDVDRWCFRAKAGQQITCRAVTSAFGSPLDARIELRDPTGNVLDERLPEGNVTPDLNVTAQVDGVYEIRIHDIGYGGLQDHVYRLTLTDGPVLTAAYPLGGRRDHPTSFQLTGSNLTATSCTVTLPADASEHFLRLPSEQRPFGEVRLDLDDFEEFLEAAENESALQTMTVPCVLNGRIQSPGDVDRWTFAAKKGTEYDFEVRAARLGSMLDAVIEISDASGKKLAEADDSQGIQTDARLRWSAPADGDYSISIRDRLQNRGDDRFGYRVRVLSVQQPDFTLSSAVDMLIVERGKTVNLKVALDRGPGFNEPVNLSLDNLPAGVNVTSPNAPLVIAPNQKELQLTLKAEPDAPVGVIALKIVGRSKVADTELVRELIPTPTNPEQGRIAVPDSTGCIWFAVAAPTPFKFVGIFETKFIPRGSVYVRKYRIDRNGFEGPLKVALADRQGRHLQGVHAQSVIVPAGESNFDFAVKLAPWMEIGRTCRSTLSVTGVVTDPDGTSHDVSFSSNDQHNQMIALVDPGRFAIQLLRASITVAPGKVVDVPVRIQRSPGLANPVSIELIVDRPIEGVSAAPVRLTGSAAEGQLSIAFAGHVRGVDIHPVIVRATTTDERGMPMIAESQLTVVPRR